MARNRKWIQIVLAMLTLTLVVAMASAMTAARRWQTETNAATNAEASARQGTVGGYGTVPPPTAEPEHTMQFESPLTLPMPALQARAGMPPLCVFDPDAARAGTDQRSTLNVTYSFGEPSFILTNTTPIEIAEWLPDGNRLLYARTHPNTPIETIETINVSNDEIHVLGEQYSTRRKPSWVPELNGAVYLNFRFTDVTTGIGTDDLVITSGQSSSAVAALEAVSEQGISLDPKGYLVHFADEDTDATPFLGVARDLLPITSIPASLDELLYPKPTEITNRRNSEFLYERSSDETKLLLIGIPYLYLLDTTTSDFCEIDLGTGMEGYRYALNAQWSPDGRHLAMITTVGVRDQPFVSFTELTILDPLTGKQRQVPLTGNAMEIDWAPNSRHLLVLEGWTEGGSQQGEMSKPIRRLILLDTTIDQIAPVLEGYSVNGNVGMDLSMAWSADGRRFAVMCAATTEDGTYLFSRVCLSDIKSETVQEN